MPTSILTLLLSLIVLALGLSACQQTNTETVNSDTDNWSCQTKDSPFTYSVCRVDASGLTSDRYSLQLFWQASNDQSLLTFDTLLSTLPKTETLNFAMNAGMYNENYAPIGYTVIKGKEVKSLNLKEGGGNFHLLPNGVMWWDKTGHVQITESHALDEQINNGNAQPWYATQSGPMLVIND